MVRAPSTKTLLYSWVILYLSGSTHEHFRMEEILVSNIKTSKLWIEFRIGHAEEAPRLVVSIVTTLVEVLKRKYLAWNLSWMLMRHFDARIYLFDIRRILSNRVCVPLMLPKRLPPTVAPKRPPHLFFQEDHRLIPNYTDIQYTRM